MKIYDYKGHITKKDTAKALFHALQEAVPVIIIFILGMIIMVYLINIVTTLSYNRCLKVSTNPTIYCK